MAELETELRESISSFERILAVVPGERTALEFLCMACAQLGENEKFLKYALALSDVILRERDVAGATDLVEKLRAVDDARAKAAVLRLEILQGPKVGLKTERTEPTQNSADPSVAVAAELELLRQLVAEGYLAEASVKSAVEQLQGPLTPGGDFLVSALLILEKENASAAADAISAVADAAHAPPVPLNAFEISPAYVRRLPTGLVRVRGAIPFARLGDEWAVAVLNPLDANLRDEVSAALDAKCHFYLAPPASIEVVVERALAGVAAETPAKAPVEASEPPPPGNPLARSVAAATQGMVRT